MEISGWILTKDNYFSICQPLNYWDDYSAVVLAGALCIKELKVLVLRLYYHHQGY